MWSRVKRLDQLCAERRICEPETGWTWNRACSAGDLRSPWCWNIDSGPDQEVSRAHFTEVHWNLKKSLWAVLLPECSGLLVSLVFYFLCSWLCVCSWVWKAMFRGDCSSWINPYLDWGWSSESSVMADKSDCCTLCLMSFSVKTWVNTVIMRPILGVAGGGGRMGRVWYQVL